MNRFISLVFAVLFPAVAFAQTIEPPPDQLKFGQIVEVYAGKYAQADNELKATAVYKARHEELKKVLKDWKFEGWLFKVESMGTTSDGHAYVVFANKGWPFKVKTWNNALSDNSDKTLIRHGTPLYDKLSDTKKDQLLRVSGRMVGISALTERGKMVDPEFVARFSAIEAWKPDK